MTDSTDSQDLFTANSIYPEAPPIFAWKPNSLSDVLDSCVVVLDTNVLLLPYSVSASGLDEIKENFRTLAKQNRLRIPGQVAREFARNRPARLAELFKQIGVAKSKAAKYDVGRYPLLDEVEAYQRALDLEKQINELQREYQQSLGQVLDHIRGWTWNDPLSTLYGDIFEPGMIVDIDLDKEKLRAELRHRQTYKIPPGYKDASKTDNSIGDLLIWFTILSIGETTGKDVMFVTGERKADWWHRSDSEPLYPRHELVDEYRRASNGRTFHIVSLSELLDLVGASAEAVDGVRQGEAESDLEHEEFYKKLRGGLTENWPEVVSRVHEINRRFAAILKDATVVSFREGRVRLYSPYEFHRGRLEDPEVKGVVEDVLNKIYDGNVSIEVTDVPF